MGSTQLPYNLMMVCELYQMCLSPLVFKVDTCRTIFRSEGIENVWKLRNKDHLKAVKSEVKYYVANKKLRKI